MRPRDFYDIALLNEVCKPDVALVKTAIKATCRHRETENVLDNAHERIVEVQNNKGQQEQWAKNQRSHPYAQGKQFEEICELLQNFV